jgi:multidrug resistance efflux pump
VLRQAQHEREVFQWFRKLRIALFLAVSLSCAAHAAVFSGEVRSDDAQSIFTPPSNSSPVVLRYYIPDGTRVKPGDTILRIDAAQAATQVRKAETDTQEAQAKIDKEVADLQLKAADAELAAIDAQAALDTALVDAALPKTLISALDYDRYQAERVRTDRDATAKRQALADAQAAAARRREDGKLEFEKLRVTQAFYQAQVDAAEVRAERAGVVVHGFSMVSFGGQAGGRFEEGSSSFPGMEVGQIVDMGKVHVRAYVFAPDRAGLALGQKVQLNFDALPRRAGEGTITSIAGAADVKPEWGEGRYFVVEIELAAATAALPLRPGMSVRVDSADDAKSSAPMDVARSGAAVIADGEVYARSTAAISPPQVEDLWMLTVTQMATDGKLVKKGDALVSFDGGEVLKQLNAKQNELTEKLRTQEKLRLELAEKARMERVTAAEAHADAVKAQRKAAQPESALAAVEYKKLVIARRKAEQHETLSREHERVAAEERAAEQRVADADAARLKNEVERMRASVDALNVKAPRDGLFLHASNWKGEKIDIGTQAFRGQSVGDIPDLATLAVRVRLPERELARVAAGDAARVLLDGGASLAGHVDDVGLSVHSKSRVEPVPVVDLRVVLDGDTKSLKPGQAVRVEIVPSAQAATQKTEAP